MRKNKFGTITSLSISLSLLAIYFYVVYIVYNTINDAITTASTTCPTGYYFDMFQKKCFPVCGAGSSVNIATEQCETQISQIASKSTNTTFASLPITLQMFSTMTLPDWLHTLIASIPSGYGPGATVYLANLYYPNGSNIFHPNESTISALKKLTLAQQLDVVTGKGWPIDGPTDYAPLELEDINGANYSASNIANTLTPSQSALSSALINSKNVTSATVAELFARQGIINTVTKMPVSESDINKILTKSRGRWTPEALAITNPSNIPLIINSYL